MLDQARQLSEAAGEMEESVDTAVAGRPPWPGHADAARYAALLNSWDGEAERGVRGPSAPAARTQPGHRPVAKDRASKASPDEAGTGGSRGGKGGTAIEIEEVKEEIAQCAASLCQNGSRSSMATVVLGGDERARKLAADDHGREI
jgi:hypothetical protein